MVRRALLLLVLALTLLAVTTYAGEDPRNLAVAEVTHIQGQGFPVPQYAVLLWSDDWRAVSYHLPARPPWVVVIPDVYLRVDAVRADVAHEVGHWLAGEAGFQLAYEDEERLTDEFAACYGSQGARTWMRIRERVRPSRERCAEILTLFAPQEVPADAFQTH